MATYLEATFRVITTDIEWNTYLNITGLYIILNITDRERSVLQVKLVLPKPTN